MTKMAGRNQGDNGGLLELLSLISGVWQKRFTPQETLDILKQNPKYEIDGKETEILDHLNDIERHKITVQEFVDWFGETFGKK